MHWAELPTNAQLPGALLACRDANSEVERIIKFQRNFYYVLKASWKQRRVCGDALLWPARRAGLAAPRVGS